jgi:WD40 repeat protein
MIELAGRKQDVDALVFSPDGKQLAVGGSASHVQLWDLTTKKARPILGPRGPHRAVGFTAEGLFSCGAEFLRIRSSSWETYQQAAALNYLHGAATADGKGAVLVGQKNYGPFLERLKLSETPEQRWKSNGWGDRVPYRVCLCPDGQMLVSGLHSTVLLDPESGRVVRHLDSHPEAVPALAVSSDGRLYAVAAGTELAVYDLAKDVRRGVRNDGRKHFTDVAFHPSGRLLAASSNNETVRLFDAKTLTQTAAFDWQVGPVRRIAFAPDGMRAAAAGKTGRVVVWDVDL